MNKEVSIVICGIPTTMFYHVGLPKENAAKENKTLAEINDYLDSIDEVGPGSITIINNRIRSILRKNESSIVFDFLEAR